MASSLMASRLAGSRFHAKVRWVLFIVRFIHENGIPGAASIQRRLPAELVAVRNRSVSCFLFGIDGLFLQGRILTGLSVLGNGSQKCACYSAAVTFVRAAWAVRRALCPG
jgi:hypothetical protein